LFVLIAFILKACSFLDFWFAIGQRDFTDTFKTNKEWFCARNFPVFPATVFQKNYREKFKISRQTKRNRFEKSSFGISLKIASFGISIVFWEQHMVASNLMWDNCSLLYWIICFCSVWLSRLGDSLMFYSLATFGKFVKKEVCFSLVSLFYRTYFMYEPIPQIFL
jgi:hypothetical protein